MSPTPMHMWPSISPTPSPRMRWALRQAQTMEQKVSYFSSQWERCSTLTLSLAASIAFSTGMTCMPMPAPPGGTSFAASSSGSCGARLNIVATSGCSSASVLCSTMYSPDPTTHFGIRYWMCPSSLSRFCSRIPIHSRWSMIFWVFLTGRLLRFASSFVVRPTRRFLKLSMKRTSCLVSIRSRIQKSMWFSFMPPGSLRGILSVIMTASFFTSSAFSASSQWCPSTG